MTKFAVEESGSVWAGKAYLAAGTVFYGAAGAIGSAVQINLTAEIRDISKSEKVQGLSCKKPAKKYFRCCHFRTGYVILYKSAGRSECASRGAPCLKDMEQLS